MKPSKIPPHSPLRRVGQTKEEKTKGLEEEEKRGGEGRDPRIAGYVLLSQFSTILLYICDTFDIVHFRPPEDGCFTHIR